MNQEKGTVPETISIVTEPDAMTFVTRKEWQQLPDSCLGELSHYETILIFYGSDNVYMLLRSLYPYEWLSSRNYRFVRLSIDENGKQVFHVMQLSTAEAEQLCQNRLVLF